MQPDHTRTHTRTVTRTTQRGWPGPPSGPMAGPWRPKSEVPATKLRFATSNVVRWSSSHAKDPTAHPKARYLLVLVGPCSHASGVIPAHVPSTPATNTTHASILPAASCHQPARAELSQAASRREHAQSAEREPLAPRLAPTRRPDSPPVVGTYARCLAAQKVAVTTALCLYSASRSLGMMSFLRAIYSVISLPADDVPAARIMRVAVASVHQVVG